MLNRVAVLVVVVMSACGLPGAPQIGSACESGVDQSECFSDKSLAVCDRVTSKWYEQPCQDRCSNAQTTMCTEAAPKVGDSCRPGLENKNACASETTVLKCTEGKWEPFRECMMDYRCTTYLDSAFCR